MPEDGADQTATYDNLKRLGDHSAMVPHLFVALECIRPLAGAARFSLFEIDEVTVGRGAERAAQRYSRAGHARLRLEVPDRWLSSQHLRIQRRGSRWLLTDDGSKNGTLVNGVPAEHHTLKDGDLIEAGSTIFLFKPQNTSTLKDPLDLDFCTAKLKTAILPTLNTALARQLEDFRRVARTPIAFLIRGESGTGKELTARALHKLSGRTGRFVGIDCGALSPTLVESELFGHKKGSFSGASNDSLGLIRAAHGGTLFLDEVAELPLDQQVKLLRVLQEQEVVPVGSTAPLKVDLRIAAATHQDLEARIRDGRFRRDLYARLVGFELQLLPLRKRREDIGLLVAVLLPEIAGPLADTIRFERGAARALFTYEWPFNVRELRQQLSAAIALADGGQLVRKQLVSRRHALPGQDGNVLQLHHAGSHTPLHAVASGTGEVLGSTESYGGRTSRDVEPSPDSVTRAMQLAAGNASRAAQSLRISRATLYNLFKRYSMNPRDFRAKR